LDELNALLTDIHYLRKYAKTGEKSPNKAKNTQKTLKLSALILFNSLYNYWESKLVYFCLAFYIVI